MNRLVGSGQLCEAEESWKSKGIWQPTCHCQIIVVLGTDTSYVRYLRVRIQQHSSLDPYHNSSVEFPGSDGRARRSSWLSSSLIGAFVPSGISMVISIFSRLLFSNLPWGILVWRGASPNRVVGVAERRMLRLKRGRQVALQAARIPMHNSTVERMSPPLTSSPVIHRYFWLALHYELVVLKDGG